ncbi:carbohydrate binding domain-containing protein [Kutzneria chonburiensis]|uniref:Carbohydrate binding domain-containing protein n=1 Tax=Kutzneria chonburiensis TaxID=1483604 RepID=A0ABV6N796_9PSEU|nr:carbohydrate binding domain-containing protein [Kutzneria chonburiensis]
MPSLSRTRLALAAALAAAMTALLTAAVLTTAPAATAATNLVTDPGFESGLTGWTCDAGTATTVSSPVHAGTKALAGTPSSAADAQCTQTISVAPNSAYTLTAFVQGSYVYLGATGTGVNASTWTQAAPSFQQLSTSFTTGASMTSVTVFVHGWYGQPTYYADDVNLSGPAGGGPPPTSTTTTTTTVTPPPNTGWTHPSYLMPLDNTPPSISAIVAGSGEKEFNLAFVLDSGGCTPAWDGSSSSLVSTDTAVAAQINAIRAAGGDAAVSFGGYNGTELGTTCGSAAALANAYQQVITKYQLKHVDFDYENGALDANTAVRFGAVAILERNNPNLVVSLTIPMTTVGFPGSGTDEIRAAVAAGARLDIVNIMDFDTGLTSGTEVGQTENIASTAASQLAAIYGWSTATAWAHLGLQLMNGHSDQPSELFTQDTFSQLLSFARANHPAWFSFWSVNRDFQCPAGVPENWAPGTCSNITQGAYDFTKIVVQY